MLSNKWQKQTFFLKKIFIHLFLFVFCYIEPPFEVLKNRFVLTAQNFSKNWTFRLVTIANRFFFFTVFLIDFKSLIPVILFSKITVSVNASCLVRSLKTNEESKKNFQISHGVTFFFSIKISNLIFFVMLLIDLYTSNLISPNIV